MAENRINFFGLSDDQLYYDERKKRFVSTKDTPIFLERQFKNSHFKEVSHPACWQDNPCSNDLTFMDKRKKNSVLSLSMGSNWFARWTIRLNLKWGGFGASWEGLRSSTFTPCSMTTWGRMPLIDQESCVPGHGKTVQRSSISSTYTSCKRRGMPSTFP